MKTASDLVASVTQLISFPEVAMQVNSMVASDSFDRDQISAVIERDAALTATLLKLANSSLYGTRTEIDSVSKAFTRIGSKEIQQLTLGVCAARAFSGIPNDLISVEDFWYHSLLCATSARQIARQLKTSNAEMVFTAGLLLDIGHLVMFNLMPEESTRVLALSRDEMDGDHLHIAEREILGFDHMEVGARLGERWNWPTSLINCIARHHEPFRYEDCTDVEVIVHVANSIANMAALDSQDLSDATPVAEQAWPRLKVAPEQVPEVLDGVKEEISGLLRIFVS